MRERTVTHHFSGESTRYEEFKAAVLKFEDERFPTHEETHSFFRVNVRPPGDNHAGETMLTFVSRAD